MTPDEIAAIQWAKLRALLIYCYEHVPYYKAQWDRMGIHWQDIRNLDDYRRLPLLTKSEIRTHYDDLIAGPWRGKVLLKATGGSTGEPLRFAYTRENYERRIAVMMRGYAWARADIGRRTLLLWGGDVGDVSRSKRFKDRLYNLAFHRKILNSFYLTRDSMPDYLSQINRYRPEVIVAFVAPLYELARFIKDKSLPRWSPETIVTGAELLHPYQRTLIEEVFCCPVHSTYGCREFMLIAAECSRRGGMHINTDHLVVEVLDDRGAPALSGEVVITDLHNYAMPFIRYVNGDLATLSAEHCPCGRGFPLMQSVNGRKLDTIRTRAGHAVPGAFFPHMFKEVSAVARFQVVQNSLEDLDIIIVKHPEFNDADLTFIQREVTKILGDGIHIKYRFVDDIPLTRSGKQRVTVSHSEA